MASNFYLETKNNGELKNFFLPKEQLKISKNISPRIYKNDIDLFKKEYHIVDFAINMSDINVNLKFNEIIDKQEELFEIKEKLNKELHYLIINAFSLNIRSKKAVVPFNCGDVFVNDIVGPAFGNKIYDSERQKNLSLCLYACAINNCNDIIASVLNHKLLKFPANKEKQVCLRWGLYNVALYYKLHETVHLLDCFNIGRIPYRSEKNVNYQFNI